MERSQLLDKIREEMRKVPSVQTPENIDENCGECTGDKRFNNCYSSKIHVAGEYDLIDNSCQTFLRHEGEKIITEEMNKKELFFLYKGVQEFVGIQLEEYKKIDAEINDYFDC